MRLAVYLGVVTASHTAIHVTGFPLFNHNGGLHLARLQLPALGYASWSGHPRIACGETRAEYGRYDNGNLDQESSPRRICGQVYF